MARLTLLLIILMLTACSGPSLQTNASPTSTAAPMPPTNASQASASPTQTLSPTPTIQPTNTAAPSPTATMTAEPTVTLPATVTPLQQTIARPADQQINLPDLDVRYELHISQLDVASGLVVASERAIIESFNEPAPDQLLFQVPAAGYGYFTLKALAVNGSPVEPTWLETGSTLAVDLPSEPATPFEISFDFQLNVGGPEASGWGYLAVDSDVLRLGYWFPQVSNDHPFSTTLDPSFTQTATFDVTLDLAAGVDFAHSGELVSAEDLPDGRRRYQMHGERIRDFDLAISPSYQRESVTTASGVLIEYYWRAGAPDVSDQVLAAASATLERLGELLIPYPWPTLRIADGGPSLPGGIEYGNMIWINPSYPELDRLLYHELAHQWFYGIIGNRTLTDGWIDEGAAEFFERGLGTDFSEVPAPPDGGYCCALDSSWAELPTDRRYYYAIYEQGARFYYAVMSTMGWNAFWAAMQEIASTYQFEIVTPYDMLTIWQRHSESDLRPLYDQYFRYPWIGELPEPGIQSRQGWLPLPPGG